MGLKVLIADDEEDLVDVLRDRLEAYGFTVITAGTGREALEKLATESVDGIFLDVKMPDLDGLAALDEIRRRDSKTPIIVITASSTNRAAEDALARGANAFVLKPFEWNELKATIEQLYPIILEP
jgi:two-component system response regulator AtoC